MCEPHRLSARRVMEEVTCEVPDLTPSQTASSGDLLCGGRCFGVDDEVGRVVRRLA